MDIVPQVTAERRVVAVTAYSRAAVLNDCTAPASNFPLQCDGLSLSQVASKLSSPFGLTAAVPLPLQEGSSFPKVSLKATEKIQGFLSDLAYQRGLVLGSDENGDIAFRKSGSGPAVPVAVLSDNEQPVVSVTATFSPRAYFSEITCISKPKNGRQGGKYTERNTFLPGVVRPITIELDDTDQGDLHLATKARIGRMFGNVASWDVELATWFTPAGEIWRPNDRLFLQADGAMIYTSTELLIRTVKLAKSTDGSSTASVNLVLPGSFSGEVPTSLPWMG